MTAEWRGPWWLKRFYRDSEDSVFHRVTSVKLFDREVPDSLLRLRHLKELHLSGCRITEKQMQDLQMHSSLATVRLANNHVFPRDSIAALAVAKPKPANDRQQPILMTTSKQPPTVKPECQVKGSSTTNLTLACAAPTAKGAP